jgi:hypothetical protein
MQRYITLLALIGIVVGLQVDAWAVSAQFNQLPIDNLGASFFNSLWQVWVPIIASLMIIALVLGVATGLFRAGGLLIGTVVGLTLLAGGIPLWNSLVGTTGQIATSIIL